MPEVGPSRKVRASNSYNQCYWYCWHAGIIFPPQDIAVGYTPAHAWAHFTYQPPLDHRYNLLPSNFSSQVDTDFLHLVRYLEYGSHRIFALYIDYSRLLSRLPDIRDSHNPGEHNGRSACAHKVLMSPLLLYLIRMMQKMLRRHNIPPQLWNEKGVQIWKEWITHLTLDTMGCISQTTFLNAFSWMKMF